MALCSRAGIAYSFPALSAPQPVDVDPPQPPRRALFHVPKLGSRQRRVLWLLAIAELFDNYDAALISLALKQIQEGLAIPEAEIARVAGTVRLGMVASFALTVFADRIGRRQLLLATVLGFSLCTGVTAFARTAEEFVIAQLLARMFIGAEVLLAAVVVIEEFAAKDRGWGIGVLGALGAMGFGIAAGAFAFVDSIPYGWRALYAAGALPLLVLAWLRRNLPETERFERHRAERAQHHGLREVLRPFVNLVRMYPRRMATLCFVVFSFDVVHWCVFGFLAKTMQDVHGFSTGQVALVVILGGALGVAGNLVAGAVGDRIGRRAVWLGFLIVHGISAWSFYNGTGAVVVAAWVGVVFAATGSGVLQKAFGGELFPTSYRSTAAGVRLIVATFGGYLGYMAEAALYPAALASLDGAPGAELLAHSVAITWMLPILIVPAAGVFLLPETARLELEEIAPELEELGA